MRHAFTNTFTAAAVSGAAAVAVLAGTGSAGADTFLRLPNGVARGEGFTVTRTNEHAQISASLAANGASRTAWVSADITLRAPKLEPAKSGPEQDPAGEDAMPGSNGTINSGAAATLSSGYIVGCQVNIEGLKGGLSGALTPSAPTVTGTVDVPLSAGEVKFVLLVSKNAEKAGTYYVGYDRTQLAVQNCGGYAQARAFTTVETTGKVHQKVSLYGKPSSIG